MYSTTEHSNQNHHAILNDFFMTRKIHTNHLLGQRPLPAIASAIIWEGSGQVHRLSGIIIAV
jgi:hypothetical protein